MPLLPAVVIVGGAVLVAALVAGLKGLLRATLGLSRLRPWTLRAAQPAVGLIVGFSLWLPGQNYGLVPVVPLAWVFWGSIAAGLLSELAYRWAKSAAPGWMAALDERVTGALRG